MIASNKKTSLRKRYVWLFVATLVFAAIIIYDISSLGGNIEFYAKWSECGQRPKVGRGSGYFNSGASHYIDAPIFDPLRASPEYFCTAIEAEREGFSASPVEHVYPALKAAEESPPKRY